MMSFICGIAIYPWTYVTALYPLNTRLKAWSVSIQSFVRHITVDVVGGSTQKIPRQKYSSDNDFLCNFDEKDLNNPRKSTASVPELKN